MSGFIKTLISSVSGFGFSKVFSAKGTLGGDYKDRQFMQHSGFSSIPKEGAQAVVLKRGENYICVATADNPDDVPNLQNAGDVAIYASSDYIVKISASGNIEIKGNGSPGSIVLGDGVADNLMKDSVIIKYNTHVHTGGVLPGALTGPPDTGLYDPTDATTQLKGS